MSMSYLVPRRLVEQLQSHFYLEMARSKSNPINLVVLLTITQVEQILIVPQTRTL